MPVQSGNQAVANANSYKTCTPGFCLQFVRGWLEIPSGAPDAIGAWEQAQHKHAEGRARDAQSPPRGAPVYWRGGSSGHGHIALAVSNEAGRSTDTPGPGVVGTRPGDWWRLNWGMDYLGWSEDLNGVQLPYLANGGRSEWSHGPVRVAKLHRNQLDSDSVARLCWRLMNNARVPAHHAPPRQTRSYGPELVEGVRYWQRHVAPKLAGPKDGTELSNPQANALFGEAYVVIEEKR